MQPLPAIQPHAEIIVSSTGISKGLAQTDGIQIVGSVGLSRGPASIFMLAKNVSSDETDGEFQLGGSVEKAVGRVELTVSATLKAWIAGRDGGDGQAAEFVVAVARPTGAVTPRLRLIYSPDDLGGTGQSLYTEAGLAWKLSPKWTLGGGIARRDRQNGLDYTAGNVGITYAVTTNLRADLTAYDSSRSAQGSNYEPRLVASLRMRLP